MFTVLIGFCCCPENLGQTLNVRADGLGRFCIGIAQQSRTPSAASEINWEVFAGPANNSDIKEFFEPNLYIYDAYPGGIGISEPLYQSCDTLLNRTLELIGGCSCENGCPSCVGPTADRSERTKEVALEILGRLCRNTEFLEARTAQTA